MRRFLLLVMVFVGVLLIGVTGFGKEIHLPLETPLAGTILIAPSFYTEVDNVVVPKQFQAWPGKNGTRPSDWFTVRIEAHPRDTIFLSPGTYTCDIWVFTPQIRITTDLQAGDLATIHGTLEVDADQVILDRIAVVGERKNYSSGHGVEINREVVSQITVRDCLMEGNEWTGIHIIGPRGTIDEMHVEGCSLIGNGMDGMDAQFVKLLVITGCTIKDNGWNFSQGVGVRIGSYVENVELRDNHFEGNRFADVHR